MCVQQWSTHALHEAASTNTIMSRKSGRNCWPTENLTASWQQSSIKPKGASHIWESKVKKNEKKRNLSSSRQASMTISIIIGLWKDWLRLGPKTGLLILRLRLRPKLAWPHGCQDQQLQFSWHGGLLGRFCLLIFLPYISTFPTLWLELSSLPLPYFIYPLIHPSPAP